MSLTMIDFTQGNGPPEEGAVRRARFGAPNAADMAKNLRLMADAFERGDLIHQSVEMGTVANNDDFSITTLTIKFAEYWEKK